MGSISSFLSQPLVGTGLGFIGVALAIYFYIKSRQIARIALQVDEIAVVGSTASAFDERLEIRFAGELVRRVTKTRAIIWNAGNVTIEGDQVAKSDPLRAVVDQENKILRVELITQSRSVNNVVLNTDGHQVYLDFDFFDKNDGFVIEITHSGARREIRWEGTLRGIPEGFSKFGNKGPFQQMLIHSPPKFTRTVASVFPVVAVIIGVVMALVGLFSEELSKEFPILNRPIQAENGPRWPLVAAGCLYAILPLTMLWMRRRRFPPALDVRGKQADSDRILAATGPNL